MTMQTISNSAGRRASTGRRVFAGNKILLTLGLVALTASLVGLAAFATFTSTTNVSQTAASGTVSFVDVSPNGAGQRLSVGASDIAAGDTMQRAVTLTNNGTINMVGTTVIMTVTAPVSSTLDTPASADTLKVTVDKCTQAWTESGPPYTYTCGGTLTTPVASANAVAAHSIATLDLTAAANNYLRVTLTLPSTAPNALQGKSSTLNYSFAGTQRAATNK